MALPKRLKCGEPDCNYESDKSRMLSAHLIHSGHMAEQTVTLDINLAPVWESGAVHATITSPSCEGQEAPQPSGSPAQSEAAAEHAQNFLNLPPSAALARAIGDEALYAQPPEPANQDSRSIVHDSKPYNIWLLGFQVVCIYYHAMQDMDSFARRLQQARPSREKHQYSLICNIWSDCF
jgi:hypothetical protein